ncbi:hypothetical protein [Halomonas colorata]|uniref:hypothetical protein n=1 Tax=Halomonas colorata TaxID=2742615 RepID=UPI00186928AD|nr:hypothetical protein [Halomonas colorata]
MNRTPQPYQPEEQQAGYTNLPIKNIISGAKPMNMPREKQLKILRYLAEHYPLDVSPYDLAEEQDHWLLYYLKEHGLIDVETQRPFHNMPVIRYGQARITARGMDFLSDDGGLSAILGVVTVKFHEETLRSLLLTRTEESKALPQEVKKKMLEAIAGLPANGIKQLSTELLGRGIEHLPAAISSVRAAWGI